MSWRKRNCYEGASKRTEDMKGKRQSGRQAFSGHRRAAAGRPVVSPGGARSRLDMEANRLLWDDGRALLRQPAAGKTQRDHRLEGWAAAGLDSASHMRQEGREGGSNCSWINVATEVRDVEVSRLRCDDGYWWEFLWVDHGRERTQGVR